MDKPLILIDPLPRTLDSMCDEDTRRCLESLGRLVICMGGRWTPNSNFRRARFGRSSQSAYIWIRVASD
jgi:hypothetical protein